MDAIESEVFAVFERLIRLIAKDEAVVSISLMPQEHGFQILVRPAPGKGGQIIGKQGRTAQSLRTLLGVISMQTHTRVTLDIDSGEEETATDS